MAEWALPAWTKSPPTGSERALVAGLVGVVGVSLIPGAVPFVMKALAFGSIGWLIEFAYEGRPRWSAVFGERRIPILPVYSFGGATVLVLAPHLAWMPILARAAIYAGTLSALEWVACTIDRSRGGCSWNYDHTNTSCAGTDGCIDVSHAAAWGVLGLIVERAVR